MLLASEFGFSVRRKRNIPLKRERWRVDDQNMWFTYFLVNISDVLRVL